MRAISWAALSLVATSPLLASRALGADVSTSGPSDAAGVTQPAPSSPGASTSRAQLVAQYPDRLADRPRAIGDSLFEASFDGDWQINSVQGFGELPSLRYGVTDAFEVTLLGARYTFFEDSSYVPGFAVRGQLHDLSYQRHAGTNQLYPYLRPGAFAEVRDRLPFHLAINGSIGYEVTLQGNTQADGSPQPVGGWASTAVAPMIVELQWSPLPMLSLSVSGGYVEDTYQAAYQGVVESDALLSVAAVLNTSRFDVRLFYTNNWYGDPRLGYVPEIGAGAAVRL